MNWNPFAQKDNKLSCYVLSDDGSGNVQGKNLLPAVIYKSVEDSRAYKYESPTGVFECPIGHKLDVIFYYDDKPVYAHNIGMLWTANCMLKSPYSAEVLCKMLDSNTYVKTIDAAEEWSKGGGKFPWKLAIIVVGGGAAIYLLWTSGVIPGLLEGFGIG